MLTKVFAGAVQAGFHGGNARIECLGDLGVTPAFLHEREEGAVLRTKLRERVAEGIEFLGVDRAGRLGDVFVLVSEQQKNEAEFLATELVDARVAGETKQPGFKLRGSLQTIQCPDHLDKDLLGQVLDVIAAIRHGVNKASDAVLVGHDEFALSPLVALLGAADEVGELGRRS